MYSKTPALRVTAIGFSARFALMLLLIHFTTAAVVYETEIPIEARLSAFTLILMSLLYLFIRDVLRLLPGSWVSISIDQEGISVVTRDGRSFNGHIEKETIVNSFFIILRIVPERHIRPVSRVIFPDAMEIGSFREWSVLLKLG